VREVSPVILANAKMLDALVSLVGKKLLVWRPTQGETEPL
jgi:hypothetical protein